MANTASAIKRTRSNARKRIRNRMARTRARSAIRAARELIAGEDAQAARRAALEAISALDKAAEKGIIHKNNASRRKSRLMKQLARMSSAAEQN